VTPGCTFSGRPPPRNACNTQNSNIWMIRTSERNWVNKSGFPVASCRWNAIPASSIASMDFTPRTQSQEENENCHFCQCAVCTKPVVMSAEWFSNVGCRRDLRSVPGDSNNPRFSGIQPSRRENVYARLGIASVPSFPKSRFSRWIGGFDIEVIRQRHGSGLPPSSVSQPGTCRASFSVDRRSRAIFFHHAGRSKNFLLWLTPGETLGCSFLSKPLISHQHGAVKDSSSWCGPSTIRSLAAKYPRLWRMHYYGVDTWLGIYRSRGASCDTRRRKAGSSSNSSGRVFATKFQKE